MVQLELRSAFTAKDAEFEDAGTFQEELPLFRKEDRNPVKIDDLIVDLRLGEIGVDGGIQSQA